MTKILSFIRAIFIYIILLILSAIAAAVALWYFGFSLVKTSDSGNVIERLTAIFSEERQQQFPLILADDLYQLGIAADRAEIIDETHIRVYIRFAKNVETGAILKVFDATGTEIARSIQFVGGNAEEAANRTFEFPAGTTLKNAATLQLSAKKDVPATDIPSAPAANASVPAAENAENLELSEAEAESDDEPALEE